MWQQQKKMAQHLLANYQPQEARHERRGGQINTNQERRTERWKEPRRWSVISLQISPEKKQGKRWKTDRKIEQKSLCKVAAMRVEQAEKTNRRAV